jgi:hypothetical protein
MRAYRWVVSRRSVAERQPSTPCHVRRSIELGLDGACDSASADIFGEWGQGEEIV